MCPIVNQREAQIQNNSPTSLLIPCLPGSEYRVVIFYVYNCCCLQELQIQALSGEIESLKNSQNPGSSVRLEELMEENNKLKYRFNILNRVSDGVRVQPPAVRKKTQLFYIHLMPSAAASYHL